MLIPVYATCVIRFIRSSDEARHMVGFLFFSDHEHIES
jgi:hypothetical protein